MSMSLPPPRPVLTPPNPRVEKLRRRARNNVLANVRGALRVSELISEEFQGYARERSDLGLILDEYGL